MQFVYYIDSWQQREYSGIKIYMCVNLQHGYEKLYTDGGYMLTQFGKLLRIIRINSGDSAKDMAKKLNLSPSYLSAIENGNRRIPSDMEQLLCEAYPLSDVDKEKIRFAILETHEILKG